MTFMIEEISKEIILRLMAEKGMSKEDAFECLYDSDTFKALSNTDNGLFAQSTPYIYEYLENEITTGKMVYRLGVH